LIYFLNSVFEGYIPEIYDLSYAKNEHLGSTKVDRNAIFDLYCTNKKGERFIIELQKIEQLYFRERTLFYSTFAIQEQAIKGTWDFKLSPIYCLGILNFSFHPNPHKYMHFGEIIDKDNQEILIDALKFGYIECPKFQQDITENSTPKEQWLYALNHIAQLQAMPEELSTEMFEDFFEKANILKFSKIDATEYYHSEKYYRDLHNIEAQNFSKGHLKGKAEGKAEGEKAKAVAVARQMKLAGWSLAQIMQFTGLESSAIRAL
jgi:predicted transposase/invertase (TIGR01784 family)